MQTELTAGRWATGAVKSSGSAFRTLGAYSRRDRAVSEGRGPSAWVDAGALHQGPPSLIRATAAGAATRGSALRGVVDVVRTWPACALVPGRRTIDHISIGCGSISTTVMRLSPRATVPRNQRSVKRGFSRIRAGGGTPSTQAGRQRRGGSEGGVSPRRPEGPSAHL